MASSSAVRSFSWSTLSTDFYYRPQAEITNFGSYRIVTVHPAEYHEPIRCSLSEISLKDASSKFLALSYCWNSSAAEQTIWCDGLPLKVTANLFAALRNARPRNSDVRLWIDQVCVDQANIIDRNEQVSKMGHIYRAATGVIVWLGEESPGSSAAMELPRKIKRYWRSLLEDPSELLTSSKTPPECDRWGEGAWPAFVALLARPWWKRLWVSTISLTFMHAKRNCSYLGSNTLASVLAASMRLLAGKSDVNFDDFDIRRHPFTFPSLSCCQILIIRGFKSNIK